MASMKEKYGHNFKTTSKKNEKDDKKTSSGKSMQEKYGHNFTGAQRESQKPSTVISSKNTQAASLRRGGASPDGVDTAEDIALRRNTSRATYEQELTAAKKKSSAASAILTDEALFDNSSMEENLRRLQESRQAKNNADNIEKKLDIMDLTEKWGNTAYREIEDADSFGDKWDNFWSQTGANIGAGRLSQETSRAFAEYAKNPTEENKQYALQLRNIRDTYVGRNANVMDDEGAILPWISQSGAQYLPQLGDQIKGVVGGGAIGGVIGAGIGSFAGPGGTAAGWKIGKHLGASVGSGASMYDVVKGAAVEGLVDEGVDIETASRMARDEGFLSAAIEAMETGGDIAVLSKLGWKGFALAYFLNIGSEMLQEGMQQGVSIATIDRAKRGEEISRNPILSTLDLAGDSMGTLLGTIWNPDSEEAQEIWEAAKEGGKISAIMGGATRMAGLAARYGVSKAVEAKDNQRMDNIGSEYQVAAEDLVNEGLSFEEGTEAHQTAQKLKAKLDAGETVSNKELAVLVAANDRAIGREASATVAENETVQPVNETLMRAAEEAVGIKKTDAVPFNVLNHNAQEATAAQNGVQSAVDRVAATQRKIEQKLSQPKYGRYGMDAFAELSESNTDNYARMRTEFEAAYQAGLAELPRNAVKLMNQTQEKAYQAGRQDYILSLEDNTRKGATVWGKKGGLVQNSESQKLDKQVQTQLDRFGRATGSKIIIDSRLVGTNQNGYYQNGEIHISPDANRPMMVVARHEVTHHLQLAAPEAYTAFRSYAIQKMNEGLPYGSETAAEEMRGRYLRSSDGDVDLTTEEAMDEVAAHFAEKLLSDEKAMDDFIRDVSKSKDTRTWAQKFFDSVRAFVEKVKKAFGKGKQADQAVLDEYGITVEQFEKAEKLWMDAIRAAGERSEQTTKNATPKDGGKVWYSINSEFVSEINAWNREGRPAGESFVLGSTGPVLRGLGAIESDIYMSGDKISKIMNDHPEMTLAEIKKIPQMLEDPVLILSSKGTGATRRNSRMVVFGSVKAQNGQPVMAVLDLRPVENHLVVDDMQKVNSAYTKKNPVGFVTSSEVMHADKKRTIPLLRTMGLQLRPIDLLRSGSMGSITYKGDSVNVQGVPFESVCDIGDNPVKFSLKDSEGNELTQEQAEYFQESQVRDGKGRLKVVYHGTTAEFNTFERGDIGFHFGNKTTARTRVGRGKNTRLMECYLNITNPIEFDVDLGSWDADYRLAESLVDMGVLTGAEAQSVLRTDDGRYSRTTGSANRKLRELLVSKGYDGIVYSNYYESGGSKSYIVFESKQAKRVDNAAPTESPDIRFSLKEGNGPEVESAEPVNSKAFAEWFGDWKNDPKQASKVVDKNGKPLVVYHGTGTTIEEFLPEFTGQGVDQYGSGFYFTTEKDTAEGYMSRRLDGKTKPGGEDNPNVIPVYLNIRNPLVVDAREHPQLFDIEVPASKAKKIIELAPNIMHPEESILGDFVDEYWEVGPKKYMIDQLARMYDWSIGSLEGDLFRDNATAFREAAHKVLGYDGVQVNFPDGSRHYVAWFPSQIKHATENSGAFSKTDNRIKFSLKDQDTLMKENAKLKEVNQTLREQFKTTKFAKVDKKALDKFTKQLLKDYASGADINDTRNALDSLYTYIANGEDGEGAVWEVAYRRAYDVAADILSEVGIMNDDLYQQYQGLRQHLRTTGLTISAEDRSSLASYGGYNEFRRANSGRIKLVNNGVPVDVAYGELAGMYPEFFDAYEYTHPADQLMHIAEILDSLEPYQVNPYSANMKESATWLANDIMERFFELPQAKPTFADKAERRLTQQVIKDQKKLDKLREQKNERIKEIIQDNREKVKQAQAKERQKRADAVKQTKEHYQAKEKRMSESRKATVLRTRIQRHVADLSKKLLDPTDKQHIPDDLRATVAALLENINLESQYTIDEMGKRHKGGDGEPVNRTELFRQLAEQYQRIVKEGSMVVDPSLLGNEETQGNFTKAIALGETRVADMGVKDLTTIWEVIRAVEHSITTANRVLSAAKYQETSDWANDINEETQSRRAMKGKDIEEIRLDLENPYTFFSHYGEAGQAIFRMLRDAQDRQEEMVLAVQKEVAHIVDPKMVKKLEETAQVFTTERGDKLTLTTAHMMEIHLLMKREQARDHLLKGGIVQPEVESKKIVRGNDAILLTAQDLGKIIGKLTPEQLTIADELQRLTSTTLADYGNEASMKAYGYKKFTGTDYWPIKSAKEGIHSNIEKGGNNTRSIKNIGLAKSVMPHASNQLDIRGIFKTFESHAADMTDYAAWLCPMEDANRLYNFEFRDDNNIKTGKTMKGLLDTVGGKGSQEYWHRLMEDIQNGLKPPRDTWYSKALDKIVGNVKGASVGANIRVIAQQPTAILRAAVILSPVDMVAGLASGGGWQTALKHSAIAQRKDMGGFDISSPMQMGEILFGRQTGWQKFNEAMMWGAATADKVTWGRIWNACEHAIARQRPNLKKGSDTFYEAVDALFTEIIDQSQVVDGVLQRSQLMRSGDSVIRQATSFMGEPTMALNMVMRAYDAWRHESDAQKRTAGRKLLSRTIVVLVATNAVNALAQSLVDAWRDDEDDEEYWERVWHQLIGLEGDEKNAWDKAVALTLTGNLGSSLNPMTYVPGVKDVASILSGYDVTRMDADVIADVIKATQTFFDTLDGDSKKTRLYGLKEFAHNISKACGISAGNILRDVWGVMRSIVIESGNIGLLYKMEKVITNIEYEGNNSRFTDILYKAYAEGHGSYEHIYSDMVKNGIDPEKIADRMEKHMMKAQGVTKTSELEQRYLAPEQQIEYDDKMSRVQNNGLWRAANDDQRKELETDIYDLVVQNKSGEKLREDISEGADYGLSETEFLLYNLALEMVDQPNGSGKLGGAPTLSEKAAAIEEVGTLSDSDIAYLWDTEEGFEAFAEGIDMETYAKFKAFDSTTFADKDKNGKSISGSKKKKIRSYLIEEQVGQEAFDYFMYEVMGYKK